MSRPSSPWWWEARSCWAVTVGGKRHTAPRSIGPKDNKKAWDWHDSIVNSSTPVKVGKLRVADLCELYLEWDAKRVKAGQRDSKAHDLCVFKLTRVCKTLVDSTKVGSLPADTIKGFQLEQMLLTWADEGLSTLYCRDLASNIKQVLAWAKKRSLVATNSLADVSLPSIPQSLHRYATRSEAAAWLRFLWRKGLRDFAFLQRCLIHTGARPSELTRATWDEVDWNGWVYKGKKGNGNHPGVTVTGTEWQSRSKTGKARLIYRLHRLAGRSGEAPELQGTFQSHLCDSRVPTRRYVSSSQSCDNNATIPEAKRLEAGAPGGGRRA